jgi:hypothetical protein
MENYIMNKNAFIILGVIFVFFAFFNKQAISILGLILIYIGVNNYQLTTTHLYLLMLWILFALLYDFRFSFGFKSNIMLL